MSTPDTGAEKMNSEHWGRHLLGTSWFSWYEWKRATVTGPCAKSCSKERVFMVFCQSYIHTYGIWCFDSPGETCSGVSFSTSALLIFESNNPHPLFFCEGRQAVLCLAGFWTVSLAPTHLMSEKPFPTMWQLKKKRFPDIAKCLLGDKIILRWEPLF